MKITVFGATGKTGLEVVKQALELGHHVSAFVRDPNKVVLKHVNLTVFKGDVLELSDVTQALKQQAAVIIALGAGNSLGKTRVRSLGTANIIESMNHHGIERILAVSAMGVLESWQTLSFMNKLFFATLLKNARIDHEAQEKHIKNSSLKWTIVRPSALTDGEATNDYGVGELLRAKVAKISRADVAAFMLSILENPKYTQKALTISQS